MNASKQLAKERGVMSKSTFARTKLYFCDWGGRTKGQEWGKCCKGHFVAFRVAELQKPKQNRVWAKLSCSVATSLEMCCYRYHYHQQTQDFVDLFIKLAIYLNQHRHEEEESNSQSQRNGAQHQCLISDKGLLDVSEVLNISKPQFSHLYNRQWIWILNIHCRMIVRIKRNV